MESGWKPLKSIKFQETEKNVSFFADISYFVRPTKPTHRLSLQYYKTEKANNHSAERELELLIEKLPFHIIIGLINGLIVVAQTVTAQ